MGAPDSHRLAHQLDCSRVDRVGAEDGAGEIRAAGADQPGQANNLPRAHIEADVVEHASTREAAYPQNHGARLRAAWRERLGEVSPDHHPHEVVPRDLRDPAAAHQLPVLEDRHSVGDLENLVQPMGDVDDGNPLLLQVPNDPEQVLQLVLRQAG